MNTTATPAITIPGLCSLGVDSPVDRWLTVGLSFRVAIEGGQGFHPYPHEWCFVRRLAAGCSAHLFDADYFRHDKHDRAEKFDSGPHRGLQATALHTTYGSL